MKITDITVNNLNIGKTILQVNTDEGIYGLGEAASYYSSRSAALQIYVEKTFKPLLIGEDPLRPERIWEVLFFGTDEIITKIPAEFIAPLDIALWDITSKAANLPLYKILGGEARKKIPLYWSVGSGWKKESKEMVHDIEKGLKLGFKAFKIRMDWRANRQDINPQKDFQMFKECRSFLPSEFPLSFDANNGYSVSTAIIQGKKFQEVGIFHFEEPIPQYDLPGLKQVVDALEVPISTGEQESTKWRFRDLIEIANPDILQPDILIAGGISEVKKIFELAEIYNKPVMPHSPTVGINGAASLQCYSTIQNATIPHEFSTEFTGPIEKIADVFEGLPLPENGTATLSDLPGLGITLNEKKYKSSLISI